MYTEFHKIFFENKNETFFMIFKQDLFLTLQMYFNTAIEAFFHAIVKTVENVWKVSIHCLIIKISSSDI